MLSSFPRSFSTTVCGACDGVGAGPPGEVGDDDVVNFIALVTFSSSSRVCSCSRCSCVGCKKGLLFTVTVSLLATLSFIDDDAISFLLCVCVVGGGGGGRDKNHTETTRACWRVCCDIFSRATSFFLFDARCSRIIRFYTTGVDGRGRTAGLGRTPSPRKKRKEKEKLLHSQTNKTTCSRSERTNRI